MDLGTPGENALDRWRGAYVRLTPEEGMLRTGRIEAVGRDGVIFQPLGGPGQTTNLQPPFFYPWHAVGNVRLIEE
jgi:hypothetical protein